MLHLCTFLDCGMLLWNLQFSPSWHIQCRWYSVNTRATNPNPPGTEPGQSRIEMRGGSCISGSADSQYPQNNWNLWALLQLQQDPVYSYEGRSLLKLVLQPKLSLESYTAANSEPKDLQPSVHTDTKRWGDFLINSRKRSYCTCNLYQVYKGFGYHSQYTTPIHQYPSPATILQPHNIVSNLQKP